jgi:hypothetical protein
VLAVKKAALLIVLSWMVSCSGGTPRIVLFPSPGGGPDVIVRESEHGNTLTVSTGLKGSPDSRMRWNLYGEEFYRVWLGWSVNGSRVSILTCSEEFGERIDRFSLGRQEVVSIEKEQAEFREADTNLEESLKDFALSTPIGAKLKAQSVFSWFCTGYGELAFNKFLKGKEFVVPPYVKKRGASASPALRP